MNPMDGRGDTALVGRLRTMPPILGAALLFFGMIAIASVLTEAPLMILVLNGLSLSMTAGLLVIYAPACVSALRRRRASDADWLVVGTLSFAAAFFVSRVISIFSRDLGIAWLVNSDVVSLRIALSAFGALCLLVAPFAGRAPLVARWRTAAVWIMAGVFLAFILLVAHGGHPEPLHVGSADRGHAA